MVIRDRLVFTFIGVLLVAQVMAAPVYYVQEPRFQHHSSANEARFRGQSSAFQHKLSEISLTPGPQGPTGATGPAGPTIYPGAGIAVSSGSAWSASKSTATWGHMSSAMLPAGGTTGQKLVKTSSSDYATQWADDSDAYLPLSGGTVTGTTLIKPGTNSTTAFQVQQANATSVFDVDTTNGGVGIGTTSPTSRLTVKGSGNTSATSSLDVQNSDGTSKLFVRDDGMVGFGTTSPGALVDVKAASTTTNLFRVFAANPSTTVRTYTSADGFGLILNDYYTGGAPYYGRWADIVASTADVSSSAIRFLTKNTSSNPSVVLFLGGDGNIGIGAWGANEVSVPTRNIDLFGTNAKTIGMGRNNYTNPGKSLTINSGGSGDANGIDVNGGDLVLASGVSNGLGLSGIQLQTASGLVSGTATNSPTTKMIITGPGNVGIGTTTPAQKLDVAGNVRVPYTYSYRSRNSTDTGDIQLIRVAGSNTVSIGDTNSGGVALNTAGTDRLMVDSTGNVGIGATSPAGKLEIALSSATKSTSDGNALRVSYAGGGLLLGSDFTNVGIIQAYSGYGSSTGTLSLNPFGGSINFNSNSIGLSNGNSSGGGSNYQIALGYPNGTYKNWITTRSSGALAYNAIDFWTNDGTSGGVYPTNAVFGMTIAGGNVGIGTTTPASRLLVKGSGNTSATSSLDVQNSDGTSKLFVRDDGNVGIGTTSPTVKLHISGSDATGADAAVPQLLVENSSTATNAVYSSIRTRVNAGLVSGQPEIWLQAQNTTALSGATIRSFGSFPLTVKTNDIERMRIDATGNVGIGTTTPAQKLDVNGTAQATAFRLSALNTAPASASDTGTTGEIRITAGYIYVCVAANTWVRSALTSW